MSLALLTLALMPFPVVIHGWGDPKLAYDFVTIIFPVDLAFAALIAVGIGPLVRRLCQRTAGLATVLWSAFALVMTLAWVAHPSSRGLHTVFELWGVAVLADTLNDALTSGFGRLVVGTIGLVALVEALWAGVQQVTGSGLGLSRLGEDPHPFVPFSASVSAPLGSMVHPYVLAGLALVAAASLAWWGIGARRPGPWLIAAGLAVTPVGFTFSRAGLVSVVLVASGFGVAALRRGPLRRRCAAAAILLCLGFAAPAAVWNGAWRSRANQTASATTAEALTTDRGQLIHEGLHALASQPATGVGPGRYVVALKARYGAAPERHKGVFKPVHNVPLLVGAEGGVVALLVMVGLYCALGWRSLRAGPALLGVYLVYLPFSMLDHFPYSFPQGLVITAVWLAVLDAGSQIGRTRIPAA